MTKRTKPHAKRKDDRCPHPAKARVHEGSVCGDCFEAIKPKPRARTPNAGAAVVRSEMIAKLEGMFIVCPNRREHIGWNDAVWTMEVFVRGMAPRAGKRTGGLGRKAKR